jgi:hypothetical protein
MNNEDQATQTRSTRMLVIGLLVLLMLCAACHITREPDSAPFFIVHPLHYPYGYLPLHPLCW